MFGKKQPDVVSDSDVGDYIRQLQQEGSQELHDFITGDEHEVVRNSAESPNGTQHPPEL